MRALRVEGDGVELAVYESGKAASEAPSVVLVHGYPDDHTVWDAVAAHLEPHFHVVRYDVRGAGASGAPSPVRAYRMERLSNDLAAVLDATAAGKKVHLVGHDWGAIQSWESATDERFASRLASFTAISGPCLDHVAYWMRAHAGSPVEIAAKVARSWYILLFHVPRLPEALWRGGLARAWPRLMKRREHVDVPDNPRMESDGVHGIGLYRANFVRALTCPRPRRAVVPVQIVAPKRDRYVSPDYAGAAEPWVRDLYVRHVDGGHWVVRARGDEAARWIADMVDHVEGRPTPALQAARVAHEPPGSTGRNATVGPRADPDSRLSRPARKSFPSTHRGRGGRS